jgi:hypothetical protein
MSTNLPNDENSQIYYIWQLLSYNELKCKLKSILKHKLNDNKILLSIIYEAGPMPVM